MIEGLLITAGFGVLALLSYIAITGFEVWQKGVVLRKIEHEHCPHHLHGRLWLYSRPIRRYFRRDIYQVCAGCGKRMNGDDRPGIVGDPSRYDAG